MSSVGSKGVIIQDALGGDAVTVTDGRLDVNATIGATIDVALDSANDSVECIQDTPGDLNATVNLITGFATSENQLAAGHTIDCNSSYVKLKAEDGTAITDGTNSGMLDVSIHASDGSAFTDSAGKMNVQVGNDVGNPVYIESNITGMVSGDNNTISDSTAEQLDGSTSGLDVACKRVDMMADPDNTGYIWVGDSGVAGNGSGGGIKLAAGDFYSIDVNNLNDIWVIATTDTNPNIYYNYFT